MGDSRTAELKQAGATRVVALVKENIEEEIAEFRSTYWSGEVYLDSTLEFYKALGGGELWNSGMGAMIGNVRAPVSNSLRNISNFKNYYSSGAKMNLRGEGLIGGGCLVLNSDGSIAYSFLETNLGEQPPIDEVLDAVRKA